MQNLLPTHALKFGIKLFKSAASNLHMLAKKLDKISLITPAERNILRRNAQFRDKHKGKRAFVIVNGPSLKKQNLDVLQNEITFVVSGFFRHEVVKKWQPTYYCILDKNFFTDTEPIATFFKQLNEVIKESIFFLPLFRGLSANQARKLLPPQKTYYVATAGDVNSQIDMTGIVQSFRSVSSFALAQAIYMGCSPIYLLGFDHDYLANRGVDQHFYTGGTVPGMAATNVPLGERSTYDSELIALLHLWKNYRSLAQIAKKKGIKIYNATNGGYLDVYERVDFETLFSKD
jgi:hypothetical protein